MENNDDKIKERVYKMFEDYKINSEQNKFYSMQRIDLIIISISTGSIAGLLSKIDSFSNNECLLFNWVYFLAILSFSFSIIFNIISQLYSHDAHHIESRWAKRQMESMNQKEDDTSQESDIDDDNNELDSSEQISRTDKSNSYSLYSLSIGFILSLLLIASFIF